MDYVKLKAELDKPEYDGLSNSDILAKLKDPVIPYHGVVTSQELLAWSGGNQRLSRMENAAINHSDGNIRNIAKVAVILIRRDGATLDLSKDDRKQMVGALNLQFPNDDQVLTDFDVTELYALAAAKRSKETELGLGSIKIGHIKEVR